MSERPRSRQAPPPTSYTAGGDAFETALGTALRRWPDEAKGERNERQWAHFAARIDARIALTRRAKSLESISDDQLVASPLPEAEKESHKCPPSGRESGRAVEMSRAAGGPHSADAVPVSEPDGALRITMPARSTAIVESSVEGSMAQSTSERERDRRGFKELAKLAGSPRPRASSISGVRRTEKDENDSGMVDLPALAAADPGAVDRASVTPLASTPLFDEEPARKTAPSRSVPPPIPVIPAGTLVSPSLPRPIVAPSVSRPVVSAQAALAAPAPVRAAHRPGKRSALGRVGAVVGFAALAAGAFFVVRTVRAPAAAAIAPEAVAVASHAAGDPRQGAVAVQAPAPSPAANPGVDPLSLPKETSAAPGRHPAPARAWHSTRGTQALVAKADPKEAEEAAPVAKGEPPAAKEAPAPPPPPVNDTLLNSMKIAATPAAAPPPEGVPVPAAATVAPGSGGVAQRPSQGQVTGALGSVLTEARGCLNDGDGISRAHVVFASDGSVQSVGLSGFAAGKPVEACIKAALTKAHVPPFAEASYGATVTVRP
jgi:hypothetical protein